MVGAERDLLFAVLAVQLGFLTPQEVLATASAWASDRSRGWAERLEESGRLDPARIQTLNTMLEQAIEAHDGDVHQTLATFGGAASGLQSFGGAELSPPASASASTPEGENVTPEAPERYRLEAGVELGQGGMGRVLLAFDEHLERTVAMKELLGSTDSHSDPGTTAPLLQRFLREARITGQLEHPGVVPVHELGRRPDGSLYYTMKVVRGRTLKAAIVEGKDLGDRLRLLSHFRDLCQTLAYAHAQGVVHRDLKPDNVMVGEFGETVLLDWGLAKYRDTPDLSSGELQRSLEALKVPPREVSGSGTVAGASLGTPAYMSPEQAEGDVERMDERSDVWGLGAVLYELLTGQPPFLAPTPLETIGKVLVEKVKPVRAVLPEAPAELADIADKALTRERDLRYSDAQAVAAEIEAYLAGGRVRAHVYSTFELVTRLIRRHKIASAALALLTAGTLLFSAVSFSLFRRAESARGVAVVAEGRARSSEREARARLADSYLDKARSLYVDRQFGASAIYAAAAAARSPFIDAADTSTRALRARAELRTLLFASRGFRGLKYAQTLPSPSGPEGAGNERTRTVRFLESGELLAAAESKAWLARPPGYGNPRPIAVPASNFYLWVESFVSPDRSAWSVGTGDTLTLSDLRSGKPPRAMEGLAKVRAAFFDRGRRLLAHYREEGRWRVRPYDTETFEPTAPAFDIEDLGWCLVSLDDQRALLSRLSKPELLIVNVASGRIEDTRRIPVEGKIQVVQLAPDRGTLMVYTDRAHFLSWPELEPGWSTDAQIVPVILDDGRVFVEEGGPWSLREPSTGAVIERSPVPRVVWPASTPDGSRLALAPRSGDFQLWRSEAPRIETVRGDQGGLTAVDVSADGRFVAFAGDRDIAVHDRLERRVVFRHRPPRESAVRLAFAPGGHRLAAVMGRQQLYVVDLDDPKPSFRELSAGPADYAYFINGLAWTADARHILMASPRPDLSKISMYATEGSEILRTLDAGFESPMSTIAALRTDPAGRWVAASTRNHLQVVLRLSDGRRMLEIPGATPFGRVGSFSKDGGLFAVGLRSGDTVIYSLPEAQEVLRLPGSGVSIDDVVMSPDGQWVVARSNARELEAVRLWHRPTGQLHFSLPGSGWGVLRFLSDETLFVSGDGFAHFVPLPEDPLLQPPAELVREAQAATPFRIPD